MTTMHKTLIPWMLLRTASVFLAALLFVGTAFAQSEITPPTPPGVSVDASKKSGLGATGITTEENPGITLGDYIVKQTAEFGGRITSNSGNLSLWDSYVDLGSGPRLLEYSRWEIT